MKLFSASGNHVGLVTKTNEILMWDIQGTVREIQPSREELGDAFALFFQPDDEDCFLVFYDDETRIIVQEIRSGEERGVFIYHLPGDLVRPQSKKLQPRSLSLSLLQDLITIAIIRRSTWNWSYTFGGVFHQY